MQWKGKNYDFFLKLVFDDYWMYASQGHDGCVKVLPAGDTAFYKAASRLKRFPTCIAV